MRFQAIARVLVGSALLGPSVVAAAAPLPYRVLNTWKVGGSGGWDYLLADPAAHLLYITHGARVEVLDTTTGKSAGAVIGLKGTHGVALDSGGKVGYISDGAANEVVVFDRKSFTAVDHVAAGQNPDGIAFEPSTRTVWAFNGRSHDVTVVDAASRKVLATIPLPGKPEFPQVDGAGTVYVNIEDKNEIVRLNAASRQITATWPLAGCESPSGLAIDVQHGRLFSVCDGRKMAAVSTSDGKVLALPAIGDGPDAAGYNAKDQLAFSSSGDGMLTVVDAGNGYEVLGNVATAKGARTMAYDSGSDRVYLVTADRGPVPAPTTETPRPRAPVLPDTFRVIVVGRK